MAKTNNVQTPNSDNGSNAGGDETRTENMGDIVNTIETPPAKPQVGVTIRGSASAIPESLLNRGPQYDWSDMGVGDHKLIPKAEAAGARASAYAHARSHGKKFASQAHNADKNYVEIWRLMDPTPDTTATQMQQQQQQVNQQNESQTEAAE